MYPLDPVRKGSGSTLFKYVIHAAIQKYTENRLYKVLDIVNLLLLVIGAARLHNLFWCNVFVHAGLKCEQFDCLYVGEILGVKRTDTLFLAAVPSRDRSSSS